MEKSTLKNPYKSILIDSIYTKYRFSIFSIGVGLLVLAASGYVEVRLPLGLVPFTFQTLVVMLIGLFLQPKEALACVGSYIFLGALGAPVWSGGSSGLAHLAGPTGGYIFGFFIAASTISYLNFTLGLKTLFSQTAIFLVAQVVIFGIGILWLSQFTGIDKALTVGLIPFVPSAAVKTLMALAIWKSLRH